MWRRVHCTDMYRHTLVTQSHHLSHFYCSSGMHTTIFAKVTQLLVSVCLGCVHLRSVIMSKHSLHSWKTILYICTHCTLLIHSSWFLDYKHTSLPAHETRSHISYTRVSVSLPWACHFSYPHSLMVWYVKVSQAHNKQLYTAAADLLMCVLLACRTP